jgi:hypothetical protein
MWEAPTVIKTHLSLSFWKRKRAVTGFVRVVTSEKLWKVQYYQGSSIGICLHMITRDSFGQAK